MRMKLEMTTNKRFDEIAALVEEVQNLHAQLFPDIYKRFDYNGIKMAMEKMMEHNDCMMWTATENGKTIAYMLIMVKSIEDSAFHYASKILHIDQIAVLKTRQHSGVGSLLLEKAESLARDLSITRLELDHLVLNSNASSFFRSKGFEPYRKKLFKIIK
jgi:GNAT superfamily N-acetyltransferase